MNVIRRSLGLSRYTSRTFSTTASTKANLVATDMDKSTGIATITMNRPPVNAFSMDFSYELIEAIKTVESNKDATGILITSAHKTVFSGGLELTEMYQKDDAHLRKFWNSFQVAIKLILNFSI